MPELSAEALEANLNAYRVGESKNKGLLATERYASFDYCYNYFQAFRERETLDELTSEHNLEYSCLQIAFYLASWGMLRGAAELLQKSARHYVQLIEVIAGTPADLWSIDIDRYSEENIEKLLGLHIQIQAAIRGKREATDTLSSKIMLGVFGNIPAFDRYFKYGFGVSTLGRKSLRKIGAFYQQHPQVFEVKIPTIEFQPHYPSVRYYPKAKLLDMIFFIEGGKTPEQNNSL